MILVDIGNTTVHFGIERGNRIIKTFRVYNKDVTAKYLESLTKKYPADSMLICSVVPSMTRLFKQTRTRIYFAGRDIKIPIKSFYNPKQIGQDRLVNAYAAKQLYPKAKIIVDFGTAITIDFLAKDGAYLGGLILPGVNLYLESLKKCALLPKKITLRGIPEAIPRNTLDSISKGIVEGFSSMINGLIHKHKTTMEKKQGEKIGTLITGGDSPLINKMFRFDYQHDRLLTLKGLLLLKKTLELPVIPPKL
ncbi:MAG: type III pantothenate kinase [Candidatus Omnitrophota bacterium]